MKKQSGFSLMEMMVVLLIISIVAAASAPMINKKMVGAAADKSPWVWSNATNIAYNLSGKNQTATVGTTTAPNTANNARIYIDAKGGVPHVSFGSNKANPINFFASKDFLLFSNKINSSTGLENTVALGPNSDAVATGVSIGVRTSANGNQTIALGNNATANGVQTMALGNNATASDQGSFAAGRNASATVQSATALGDNARAQNRHTVALGSNALAQGNHSMAIGTGQKSVTINGVNRVFPAQVSTNSDYAIAIGTAARVTGDSDDAVAIGESSNANGSSSVALGSGAIASGSRAIAIGEDATTAPTGSNTSSRAIAMGIQAQANRDDAIAIGSFAKATNSTATAIGMANASGSNSIAIGLDATAANTNSIAIGKGASSAYQKAVAIGPGATAVANDTIVLGTSSSTVYIPGNIVVDGHAILAHGTNSSVFVRVRKNWTSDSAIVKFKQSATNEINKYILRDQKDDDNWVNHGIYTYNHPTSAEFRSNGIHSSDRRLKNVGKAFKGGLEEIKKLETFHYTFKKDPNKTPRVGVMAQDLQKIFPEAVFKGEDGFLRIRMEDMFYAVINAIKELDLKLTAHDKKIEELTKQNQELAKQNQELVEQNKKLIERMDKIESKIKKLK